MLYHINFIVFLLLIMSGDVELNPGPLIGRNRQCRVLCSNIRGLYGNLHDLIVASKGFVNPLLGPKSRSAVCRCWRPWPFMLLIYSYV